MESKNIYLTKVLELLIETLLLCLIILSNLYLEYLVVNFLILICQRLIAKQYSFTFYLQIVQIYYIQKIIYNVHKENDIQSTTIITLH